MQASDRLNAPRPSAPRARSLRAGGAPRGSIKSLIRLAGYLRPHWKLMIACYATWLVMLGVDSTIPLAIRRAVDLGIGTGQSSILATSVLLLLGLYLVKAAFNYVYFALYHYYEAAAGRDIRYAMYTALQRLSYSYFDRVETGQLISRSTSDVEAAQHFLGHGVSVLVHVLGTYTIVLSIAFTLSWQLTLFALATMPIVLGIGVYFGKEMRPLFSRVQQQHGVMTGILQENLAGIRVVKAFAREPHEVGKFEGAARELLRRQIAMIKVLAVRLPMMTVISGIGTIFVIWYGGWMAIQGMISVGTLIAFNYYLARLTGPTLRLGWIVNMVARAFASADRIFEVLDTVPQIREKPRAVQLKNVRGEVCFEDVWFEFEPGRPVLQGINLEVKPGEVIGVVGMTGSGKSALTCLIPRFYDVTRGRVTVDGVDVRDITLDSLRRNVSIVQQDPFLFSRSLRENIAFGRPDSGYDRVQDAAEHAQAHRFALHLPQGYETIVGDRGLSLSGGQRQRTTLARALLVEPGVLILDDAVSSVDVETEQRIEESLRQVRGKRTTFIIAHRISTVQHADRIIVLEDGKIVETGRHDDLIRLNSFYARLHRMQLRDESKVVRNA